VTIPDAPVHFDVTRIALIDALGNLPLGEHLHLEPRGRMADALLAQMPAAAPLVTEDQAREIMQAAVEAEKPRLLAEIAAATDAHIKQAVAAARADERKQVTERLLRFADLIREQP
jgi:hypothetical protein